VGVTFDVVFAVFVAAMVALAVTAVRWGIRRDRARASPPPAADHPPDPADTDPGAESGRPGP
jgi:hypothetical protein